MKNLFLAAFSFMSTAAFAQTDTAVVDTRDSGDVVFQVVQVEAQFPGGLGAWGKYLATNLNADLGADCIKLSRKQKSAKQTVIVSFIVDTAGNISNVEAFNRSEVHPRLAQEAIRVIANGPNWVPAVLNDRKVISRKKQPITWVVEAN